jgi:hypothetical protein
VRLLALLLVRYSGGALCKLGLAACMSDARPRPLNARFRSTESATIDSFSKSENPKPKPVRFTSKANLSKTDFIIDKLLIKNVLLC